MDVDPVGLLEEPAALVKRRVIPIRAVAQKGSDLFVAHQKIYPRTIQGLFSRWRWLLVLATQLFFYAAPWIQWGERQALLFDLEARRFYILGLVLYPQDLIYLTGLLVISALSLFLFTAVAGRLWCGFACPQTVYSEIFLWVERKIEGNRIARMRLDNGAFSAEKLVRKWFKHLLWLGIALWTGFTFVGFFTPIRGLGMDFLQTRMGSWEVFWVFFYGLATYGNAAFLREQVCKYMCPYARFQSAMFDRDTLIVSYDAMRGDPRGVHAKGVDPRTLGQGDCIDCGLCVEVCPMGIDIRHGLQYECIGCGLCIDACSTVMDRLARPHGLIRLATQNSLAGQWMPTRIMRRVLRPRVLVYAVLLMAVSAGVIGSLILRMPLKVDVVRDRGSLARLAENGRVENVFRLQIMNATESPQRYVIEARGLAGLQVWPAEPVEVGSAQARWVPVSLRIPPDSATAGSHEVYFHVRSEDGTIHVAEKAAFVVPR